MRKGRKRRFKTAHVFQIVSLAIVAGLAFLIIGSKLGARGAHAAPRGAPSAMPALTASAVAPVSSAGAPPAASSAAAAPGGTAAAEAAPDKSDDDNITNLTLDGTVIQTPSDFSDELSQEQKDALGTGPVPIHREGRYRSVLANPKHGGPATIKVGLVVSEIRDYAIQTGSFGSDFFMSFTSDKPMPKVHPIFANGQEVSCQDIVDSPMFRFSRCTGSFTSSVDLRDYPFDTQHLDIIVEDIVYGIDTLVFVPDPQRTSLDSGFRLQGYGVASIGANAFKHQYPPRFDRDDLYVSRYKFTIGLDRFAQSAAFSVYVPAIIIVLISLMGLWCRPSDLDVRSNAGAPMLAAAVLFHYSLIQSLPATGYLTHADKLMLGVYVSLLINMATTWAFLLVEEDKLDGLFRFFRAWVPPLTFIIMFLSVVL